MRIDGIPRQVRLALAAALAFAGAEAVLLLAIPAAVLALVEGVLPAGDLDLLEMVAAVPVAAVLAVCVLRGARRRILLRASLWLEHVLAARCGDDEGGRTAIATVARFVAGRDAAALTEAPWLVVPLAAVALISPVVALVALAGTLIVLATAAASALLAGRRLAEAEGVAGHAHETAGARLVARYLGEGRSGTAEVAAAALAGIVLAVAGVLVFALVVRGAMSLGAALAASVLAGLTLRPAVATVPALARLVAAALAWRALAEGNAAVRPPREEATSVRAAAEPAEGSVRTPASTFAGPSIPPAASPVVH